MHGNVSLHVGSLTTLLPLKQVLWAGESLVYPQKCDAATNTCPRNPDARSETTSPQPPKWQGTPRSRLSIPFCPPQGNASPKGP